MRNTRANRKVEFDGEWLCVSELAEISGVSKGFLLHRLNSGMDIYQALSWPRKKRLPK
jgi:hypothetical protein